jgi:quercetin dioxygenase-like cupin family protein
MIAHDQTTETYIVISGSGTLVTGGQIVKGRRSPPESEVTKILNGPSCSGTAAGNIVSRKVVVGDITVIPAGVPHGWTDITDHVDYLSVRPDPDKVLEHGYVNPALKK